MKIFGVTDKGKKRIINEDSFLIHLGDEEKYAFAVVCDGMGGANGGEVASALAVEVIKSQFDTIESYPKRSQWGKMLRKMVAEANNQIFLKSCDDNSLYGMGTTMVGFFCNGSKVTIANVGDSRAYLISEEDIKQLTKDHSLVNELIEKGELSVAQAYKHPNKNVITRALGVENNVQSDLYDVNVSKGQYILLCGDGLTEEVSEPEIHFEVVNSNSVEEACNALISLANSRGGHDNITVVICEF